MNWYEVSNTHYPFWETRMKVSEIIDGMKIGVHSGADVMDIYNTIIDYSKAHRFGPKHFSWALTEDNVLTVNGKPLKRVGPKKDLGFLCDDAKADYWEGRILERQEAWMD